MNPPPATATPIHRVNIDKSDRSYSCSEDDTLLSAGLRSGLGMPHECMSGSCGKCYFDLLDGEVEDLWENAPGLSPRARSRGRRLACQSRPKGDCRIKLRLSDEYLLPLTPHRRLVSYTGARELAPGMAEFTFTGSQSALFKAGQFCLLDLPEVEGRRAYSMSNTPNEDGLWEFVIREVPGGAGTGRLFNGLAAGDKIAMDGPYGRAYLRSDSDRNIVCIAGGSGLSPILSIARAAVRDPSLQNKTITVFYGGRTPADICLTQYWDTDPILRNRAVCHTAISDFNAPESTGWAGHKGFIHETVEKVLGHSMGDNEYYICGPTPMVEAVTDMLVVRHGVSPHQLHFDSFY
jgi:toluene monooxygenase electron transfer component